MVEITAIQSHDPEPVDTASAEFTQILVDLVNVYEERLARMEDLIAALELQRCSSCFAAAHLAAVNAPVAARTASKAEPLAKAGATK